MKVIKLTPKAIEETAHVIREGGIVCFPTDTIYGLLADATNYQTVKRLYEIRRPSGRPFILLVSANLFIEEPPPKFDLRISDIFTYLMLEFNATFVFYKRTPIPQYLLMGRKSLAIRIPSPKSAVEKLIDLVGRPLTAPSANPEGLKPATNIKEAIDCFGDKIDLYVDAGKREGKPSTIVRCHYPKGIRLIREGNIPFKKILKRYQELISSFYGLGDAP